MPAHLTRRRLVGTAAALLAALGLSIVVATLVGPVRASLATALAPGGESSPDFAILFRARLPRVLLGAVVGGALACSGAALQALLGNPLADPHLLGVSAGAAVAGAIALVAGADPVSPVVPLAAFLGALGTVGSVFLVAQGGGQHLAVRDPARRASCATPWGRGDHAGERARELHAGAGHPLLDHGLADGAELRPGRRRRLAYVDRGRRRPGPPRASPQSAGGRRGGRR